MKQKHVRRRGPLILYGLYERRPGNKWFGQPIYIGIGTRKRPRKHLSDARRGRHYNEGLQKVCRGHIARGLEPEVRILAILPNREYANLVKIRAIKAFGRRRVRSENGCLCNIAKGGDGPDSELMRDPQTLEKLSAIGKARWKDAAYQEQQRESRAAAHARPEVKQNISDGTRVAINRPDTRKKHLKALKRVNAGQSTERRSAIQKKHHDEHPERRARTGEVAKLLARDPAIQASRSAKSTAANHRTWADDTIRQRRVLGMQGKKKTPSPQALAARRANLVKAHAARALSNRAGL